jgi:hypothetical protein
MTVNCAGSSDTQDNKWLIDSAASHNITGDLQNLSIHSEYDGTDGVFLGDGTSLAVTHIGSLALPTPTKTFHLHDTLCVPHIHKNLISVHHFTKHNNVFLELHPFFFLVKDKTTGAILLRGAYENDVYMFPNSLVAFPTPKKVAYVHERTSLDGWHKRLGHPSIKIVQHLVNQLFLPVSTKKNFIFMYFLFHK